MTPTPQRLQGSAACERSCCAAAQTVEDLGDFTSVLGRRMHVAPVKYSTRQQRCGILHTRCCRSAYANQPQWSLYSPVFRLIHAHHCSRLSRLTTVIIEPQTSSICSTRRRLQRQNLWSVHWMGIVTDGIIFGVHKSVWLNQCLVWTKSRTSCGRSSYFVTHRATSFVWIRRRDRPLAGVQWVTQLLRLINRVLDRFPVGLPVVRGAPVLVSAQPGGHLTDCDSLAPCWSTPTMFSQRMVENFFKRTRFRRSRRLRSSFRTSLIKKSPTASSPSVSAKRAARASDAAKDANSGAASGGGEYWRTRT